MDIDKKVKIRTMVINTLDEKGKVERTTNFKVIQNNIVVQPSRVLYPNKAFNNIKRHVIVM